MGESAGEECICCVVLAVRRITPKVLASERINSLIRLPV